MALRDSENEGNQACPRAKSPSPPTRSGTEICCAIAKSCSIISYIFHPRGPRHRVYPCSCPWIPVFPVTGTCTCHSPSAAVAQTPSSWPLTSPKSRDISVKNAWESCSSCLILMAYGAGSLLRQPQGVPSSWAVIWVPVCLCVSDSSCNGPGSSWDRVLLGLPTTITPSWACNVVFIP